MPGTNDLGPFGPGVQPTTEEPANFGDSGGSDYTWFKDCSSPTADDGTRFTSQWANRMLKYIRRACDGMGIARAENDMDRLYKAILAAIRNVANVGGAKEIVKSYDAGSQTFALRTLEGAGGIVVDYSPGPDSDKIIIDGSGIVVGGLAPFFPEAETSDGKLTVTAGSGQVIVGNTETFLHRGTRRISLSGYTAPQRTFNTTANKTYHLRWRWNNGSPALGLFDLANVGYNPGSLPETNVAFDSTYDDMLIAKVETNGANGITITPLINKDRYYIEGEYVWNNSAAPGSSWQNDTGPLAWSNGRDVVVDFARKVQAGIIGISDCTINSGVEYAALAVGKSRYKLHVAHTTTSNPQGRFITYFARM